MPGHILHFFCWVYLGALSRSRHSSKYSCKTEEPYCVHKLPLRSRCASCLQTSVLCLLRVLLVNVLGQTTRHEYKLPPSSLADRYDSASHQHSHCRASSRIQLSHIACEAPLTTARPESSLARPTSPSTPRIQASPYKTTWIAPPSLHPATMTDSFDNRDGSFALMVPEDKGRAAAWILNVALHIKVCQIVNSNDWESRSRGATPPIGVGFKCTNCGVAKSVPISAAGLKHAVEKTFLNHVLLCEAIPQDINNPFSYRRKRVVSSGALRRMAFGNSFGPVLMPYNSWLQHLLPIKRRTTGLAYTYIPKQRRRSLDPLSMKTP
jgi:hypothetical protein